MNERIYCPNLNLQCHENPFRCCCHCENKGNCKEPIMKVCNPQFKATQDCSSHNTITLSQLIYKLILENDKDENII